MRSDLALVFTPEDVAVWHWQAEEWACLGRIPVDDPTTSERMREFLAQVQSPGLTRLVLPEECLFRETLPPVSGSLPAQKEAVLSALDGRLPVPVEDVVTDHRGTGEGTAVVAVCKKDLEKAENFARQHGVLPACFVGASDRAGFPGTPWFGLCAVGRPLFPESDRPVPSHLPPSQTDLAGAAEAAMPKQASEHRQGEERMQRKRSLPETFSTGITRVRQLWRSDKVQDLEEEIDLTGAGILVLALLLFGLVVALIGHGSQEDSEPPAQEQAQDDRGAVESGEPAPRALAGADTPDLPGFFPVVKASVELSVPVDQIRSASPAQDDLIPVLPIADLRAARRPGIAAEAVAASSWPQHAASGLRPAPQVVAIAQSDGGFRRPRARPVRPGEALKEAAERGADAPAPDSPALTPKPRPERDDLADRSGDAQVSPPSDAVPVQVAGPAGLRPRPRPVQSRTGAIPDMVPGAAAAEAVETLPSVSVPALSASLRPRARPERLPLKAAPAVPRAVAVVPAVPTNKSVSQEATDANRINLRQLNLIGVYGPAANRRALLRLPNGRYKKVGVGDRVDGGRVAAISSSEIQYVKGGRTVRLRIPN
ncbi:hypothetical protein C8N32_11016 [Rhodovulum imhoffii]|uniref:Type IV pilus biogenesis protein PilP n=1 Tax=Rhodovulum imhoffii TaxID=365340 RepID=A0A2T5BR46_9RHOB|nr:hypothetical protein [Rhodovulum imhoffii]MBK5934389.1 hypothetical protein [Rhodovulum imhoffii]PTN01735.1 hypothetical protein C8N32_11016 [Rhodovulum imhoffii]